MSLVDILKDKPQELLSNILVNVDKKVLISTALKFSDEELFEYVNKKDTIYKPCDICCCKSRKIVTTIIKNMKHEQAAELFDYLILEEADDFWIFDLLMKSGHIVMTNKLMESMVEYDYEKGVRYFIRNDPEMQQFITDNVKLFRAAVKSNSTKVMDILYVYNDINSLSLDEIVLSNCSIMRETLDMLAKYGYDLVGQFTAMSDEKKKKIDGDVYIYFHDLGIYYNANILCNISWQYTSKTYWNIPEESRSVFNDRFIMATQELEPIEYADRLISNAKTDITIVCLYD